MIRRQLEGFDLDVVAGRGLDPTSMKLLEDNSDAVAGRLEVNRIRTSIGRVGRVVDWKDVDWKGMGCCC